MNDGRVCCACLGIYVGCVLDVCVGLCCLYFCVNVVCLFLVGYFFGSCWVFVLEFLLRLSVERVCWECFGCVLDVFWMCCRGEGASVTRTIVF